MRGLNFASADGHVLKVFQNDPNDTQSLPANTVYAITIDAQRACVDRNRRRRVGASGGVSHAPKRFVSRPSLAPKDLTSDTLYGIVADGAGDLWLSGNAGLMRFNPGSRAIKAYHREHGLQGEEFAFGASYRMRDGRVCFGGPGGFNIFDPARLTENRQSPRLALTNVDVLGARMQSATPFWLLQSIPLSYRDSIVSLDFGVFDFGSLKHNRLAYRMPGLTDEWIELGNQRRITLTTLPAGKHVLEVRAASSDSVWSPTTAASDHSARSCAVAVSLGLRYLRCDCVELAVTARSTSTAKIPGSPGATRSPGIRSAAAHARAGGEQSTARGSGAGEEQLPGSHEPRVAHADERRGRHDRAAVTHRAVRDPIAPDQDDSFVGADPAANRQRLAGLVEDPGRQGGARALAHRSRARCWKSAPACLRARRRTKASN